MSCVTQKRGRVKDRKNVMVHATTNLISKVQFCLSLGPSVLTPLKLQEVQASNLAQLITTP